MIKVKSPLTNTSDVTEVDQFDVAKIVAAYKMELGISVEAYFQDLKTVSLYKCNATGFRFYFPFSIESDSVFYEQLMRVRELYYPGWKWENEVALKTIRDGDAILDVGCGDGAFLLELTKRRKVNATGLDFNPTALQKAASNGLNVFNMPVQEHAKLHQNRYDVVTSFQVLEHITDVHGFLSAKLDLVKPGGKMIVGVPYSNPYLYRKDKYHALNLPPHHMGLWNKEAMKSLAGVYDIKLEQVHIERIDDFSYYTFVQMGLGENYKALSGKSKWIRGVSRLYKRCFTPPSGILKGRTIVGVFQKK